ncbi:MAG: adenylate/guanylate cyclase domain-containing protein [Polyangiaceae bacterium]|nr:adenylate/guanylate cyclase domain-containing protein [Polyangiaceae bacterium]
MTATLTLSRVVDCQADVCALWDALTDTDRLNRATGMERVEFTPRDGEGAARFVGKTVLGGIPAEYDELPFEFEHLTRYRVRRRMHGGPASELTFGIAFLPLPGEGTRVTVELGITPRLGLLAPFLRLSALGSLRRLEEEVRRVDRSLAVRGRPAPLPRAGAIDERAIADAAARLAVRCDPDLARRLVALVRDGSDVDAGRIRPFALAAAWGLDRREVLAAALSAVKVGLLDLRWELVCPSCRVASGSVPTLAELSTHGACQLCDLEFELELDESVEATFSACAAVREVDAGPYCIGGPARTPHVVSQRVLPAGSTTTMSAPCDPGRYRLFVRGGASVALDVEAGLPARAEVSTETLGGAALRLGPGAELRVTNAGGELHAKIEQRAWVSQAATAREVTALAAFRRDFSSEVLRPGATLRVSRVALFFSDLTGSTQLYSEIGDAAAFRLVQDHFDVVLGEVERHHGSLVKTIGDAVMAVFSSETDAVAASVDVLGAFARFRASSDVRGRVDIKIGVFGGPCFVVTANGALDYFGQTVNIAARLQAQAGSGELVVDEALGARAEARGLLDGAHVGEPWVPELKGVGEAVRAVRVRLR